MKSTAWGFVKRLARRAAPVLALGLVFVISSTAGFVIHLGTKPGRRFVARVANELVSELLVSDLTIERIEVLSPRRLLVSRVTLVDRLGKPVLLVEGLDVRFGLITLLDGILGGDDVRVFIPDVRAEKVTFGLTQDPKTGAFTVETAFDPAKPSAPGTPPTRVFVALPHIAVKLAKVTTNVSGIEKMTVNVAALDASLDVSPKGLVLGLKSDDLRVSGLLPRDVKGRLRSELRLPGTTRARLDGRLGEVPIDATFAWRGTELEFGLDSELRPAAMRELLSAWPILAPLRVKAHAAGPTSSMKVSSEGELDRGHFTSTGTLALTPEIASELAVRVRALDLRSFDERAPETALDVDANITIRLHDGLKIEVTATLPENTLAGYPVPPTKLHATYAGGTLTGDAVVLDPKLTTTVDFVITPSGKIEFATKSKGLELDALARYGVAAKGKASIHSQGVLDQGRLTATFDASLAAPGAPGVRAERVAVHGRIDGPVGEPKELSVEVEADGEKLDAQGVTFRRFRATSKGTAARQAVTFEGSSEDGSELEVSAALALDGAPALSDVHLESRHDGGVLEVGAKRVAFDAGGVTVSELSLRSGEGAVQGSIAMRGNRRVVDFTITNLDLGRVLAELGLKQPGIAGKVDGRIAFEELGSERNGRITLELHDGALPPLADVSAELAVDLAGEGLDARLELAVRDVTKATLEAQGELRSSVFDARALDEITGSAKLAVSELDLEQASTRWLGNAGVLLRGTARAAVQLKRLAPRSLPVVTYELGTRNLSIAGIGEDGKPAPAIRIDVDSEGEVLGAKGSQIALTLVDAQGPWIAASIEHSLGAEAIARSRGKGLEQAFLDAPLKARITAYRRPLKMFGAGGASALDGSVAGVVGITGSARLPELDASIALTGAGPLADGKGPLDIVLRYSAAREEYAVEARTTGESDQVELHSAGHFGWLEHGLGRDWSAKGGLSMERVGLARLARLIDAPIAGELSGRGTFDIDAHTLDAKLEVELKELSVERQVVGNGSGNISIDKGNVEARFGIESRASMLELVADSRLATTKDGPKLDPRAGGALRATARNFDLSVLRPFVRSIATRVSGRLNGHAELGWGGEGRSGRRATTLRANVTIADGSAALAAGGGLLQDIRVHALADGKGPLRFTFSGAARSHEPNMNGSALLLLDGPRLKRFDANLTVRSFPLLYEGVLMGRATTEKSAPPLKLSIVAESDKQTVEVDIPAVEVKLPPESDTNLIALDDDRSIAVAETDRDSEKKRNESKTAGTTTLKVRLGNRVRVTRGALDVPVGGAITIAPDGRLTGSITIRSGVVPALGQIFRIRRGIVKFENQDVKDATLSIQLTTRVADGTTVDIDVAGTLRDPVITFHSDPPRSESEIIALLLGIQTDSSESSDGELSRMAVALAMNRVVEGSVLSGLQFGAGETGEGEAVSTVSVRVANTVWVEGRTVKGSDTSVNQEERTSGVIDWRFAPAWSLRGQLGDVSGVEIRWSFRY